MKSTCIRFLVCAAWLATAAFVEAAPPLTRLVPAGSPFVVHVRSIPELRTNWGNTSFARAWADPEIRKFLAPMIDKMIDGEDGLPAAITSATGMSAEEFFALFPGEAIMALRDFGPHFRGEGKENPQIVFAIEAGDAVAKLEAALTHAREKSEKEGESEVEEEFQGETIHVTVKTDSEDPAQRTEAQAWAIVDGIFIVAEPKSVVQETIAALKKGGLAESLADDASFTSLYRKSPEAGAVLHVGIQGIVTPLIASLESSEGRTDENGNPTGPAAQLAQVGLTPRGLFHTLGLDALNSLDCSVTFGGRETVVESDLSWTERRGLLRMFAMGEPPVPQPDFIPESWVFAGVDRFSIPEAYNALMTTLSELSPMLDGLVRQQIKNANAQVGIDIERDFIGSFGDVMISGYALPPDGATPGGPMDQFIAISLSNPDAFATAMDAIIGGSPLSQMLESRDYLGEKIRGMTPPGGKAFAFAITRGHLLVSIGGPAMVESAIQGLQGGAVKPFWKKTEVVNALRALPDGASSILVADLGRMMELGIDLMIQASAKAESAEGDDQEGEGGEAAMPFRVDPSARPSPETIAKYWSMMSRGIYLGPNGFHFTLKMANAR